MTPVPLVAATKNLAKVASVVAEVTFPRPMSVAVLSWTELGKKSLGSDSLITRKRLEINYVSELVENWSRLFSTGSRKVLFLSEL